MEYHFSTREKNGSICLILSYKINRKWRQKTRQGFKTKREARAAQDELLKAAQREAKSGTNPELANITLADFAHHIFLRDKRNTIEYGTVHNYLRALKHFDAPAGKPIKDITEGDIINAYNAMDGTLSVATANQMLSKITAVLNYAVRPYKIRPDNPALMVKKKRDKRPRKVKAFTREEAETLINSMNKPLYKIAVLIALNTGMRISEIAGLTWEDVDFFHQTITVNKQWNFRQDGSVGFKPPKSKNSTRTLHLTASLAKALKEWKAANPHSIDGRIFPDLKKAHGSINNAIGRFKPGFSFHALRHTFATLLLSETQDINLVAAVLGDNPATVITTYVHYTQDIRKKANQYIDKLFGG